MAMSTKDHLLRKEIRRFSPEHPMPIFSKIFLNCVRNIEDDVVLTILPTPKKVDAYHDPVIAWAIPTENT